MEKRGDTTKEKIELRVKNAAGELEIQMRDKHIFNYRIINDDIEVSKSTLKTLVGALYSKELELKTGSLDDVVDDGQKQFDDSEDGYL